MQQYWQLACMLEYVRECTCSLTVSRLLEPESMEVFYQWGSSHKPRIFEQSARAGDIRCTANGSPGGCHDSLRMTGGMLEQAEALRGILTASQQLAPAATELAQLQ